MWPSSVGAIALVVVLGSHSSLALSPSVPGRRDSTCVRPVVSRRDSEITRSTLSADKKEVDRLGNGVKRRDALRCTSLWLSSFLLASTAFPAKSLASGQRCDPGDPRCKADGTIQEELDVRPVPRVTNEITHVVQITYSVGERREEVGFVRFGLYGKDCPESVKEMLQFLTSGIKSMSEDTIRNSIGMQSAPVALLDGGVVPNICSNTAVEFGVPSQSKAFAATRGMRTAGPDFLPQERPTSIESEKFPRPHDVAGLVSIPAKGIGYGEGASEPNDAAYKSAFLIIADAASTLDAPGKIQQRVIGQVIDDASMANLARLASLPIQKGLKGVVPGQSSGPPLLKVTVQDIGVQQVKSSSANTKKKK